MRLILLATIFVATTSSAADLTCPSADTLEGLATCIRMQMPRSGSGGFVTPAAEEQAQWGSVVRRMLEGSCAFELPPEIASAAALRTFTDASNGRTYCLLMEVRDGAADGIVDRGWGTFIVDQNARREIVHQAPHPIADATTEAQAISIFKGTSSRAYLLGGAHRLANGSSSCQSSYGVADAAHNVDNMFQATVMEMMNWYGSRQWTAIQWHGMAAATCPDVDVYLSHGRNEVPAPTDRIAELRNRLLTLHPHWRVATPGTGACSLNATDNTQGRLLNLVPPESVCSTPASQYTGRFIHVEQDPEFRDPASWIPAINSLWPEEPLPKRRRAVRRH